MKIVLLGYMGVGKSTIGKILANRLKLEHVDIDSYIELKQKSSISEIFETYGEIKFRKLEHFYLNEIISKNNTVISTGGGTPCFSNNMQLLLNCSVTFYLKADTTLLYERLSKRKLNRPLLQKKDTDELKSFIVDEVNKRERYYSMSNHIIQIDHLSSKEITDSIEQLL